MKPLHPEIEGFSITAGNAAGVNDGAAAMVMADGTLAGELGLQPLAVVRAWASAGVPPADTGLAPTIAIPKALERAGVRIGDVDLWEINEAFASMCVATTRILEIDDSIVNVLGSGCSLGHPIAMTGARMVISLVHELRSPRRRHRGGGHVRRRRHVDGAGPGRRSRHLGLAGFRRPLPSGPSHPRAGGRSGPGCGGLGPYRPFHNQN